MGQHFDDADPDGSVSGTFAYNAAGQPLSLASAISSLTYNPAGATYANGVSTTYAYSATRGWLSSISTVKGANSIESLTYGRDAAGRITSVTGGRADESWTYGYDALDRLLSAANVNTPSLSRTYTYDLAGNLTSNSAIGSYGYPTQGASSYQPHAVTSAGNWTFGYDLNGNQTTRHTGAMLDREIVYDAENRPVSVTANGNTVGYVYGPDGSRLKKVVGANVTTYLADDIELDPAGGWTNYHGDHQASIRAVTDSTGAANRVSAFEPYDTEVETVLSPLSPSESKGYIGERMDPESGLTYLHARYYDQVLGRFLQPDWWDVRNPGVGTNRYAYAGGNPIGLSDPWGHVFAEEASLHPGTKVVTVNGNKVATSNTESRTTKPVAAVQASLPASVPGSAAASNKAGVAPSLVSESSSSSGGGGSGTTSPGYVGGNKASTAKPVTEAPSVGAAVGGIARVMTGSVGLYLSMTGPAGAPGDSCEFGCSVGGFVVLPTTTEDLEREANVEQVTKGKTKHGEKTGGMAEADKDFNRLTPGSVKPISTQYGPGRAGVLQDGTKVTVRPGSSSGEPTLEWRGPNGRGVEIRYVP